MKLVKYILLVVILFPVWSQAAKYAGDPFSLGVGGRALALGGAVIAGPFDATAAYWNPAGMTRLSSRNITAMHAETFGSLLNHDYVGYIDADSSRLSTIKAFGFYVYYLGGGGIKITRLNELNRPYVEREESHSDLLLAGAIAGKLSSCLAYGAVAKIIYRDIGTESGRGLTADMGLLYRLNHNVDLGLMVTDITTGFIRYSGDSFSSGGNTESIYPTVRPGLAISYSCQDFDGRMVMSGDIKFEHLEGTAQYWSGSVSLDTHYGWEIGYRDMVFGRAGFDVGRFTAGSGVSYRDITLDFAYLHDGDFDATFRVSAAYRF